VFSIFFFRALRNPHFARKARARLAVQKMYKLFIGGKFVQGENAAFCRPLSKKRSRFSPFELDSVAWAQ
jgi:hypothetical protein